MDDSVLNKAHQQHRRAEAHIRYKRFDEAIECHKKAAEQLEEAKKLTMVAKALQSLQLQQDFHNSQEDFIRNKKVQFETYKKAVENQRQKMIQGLGRAEEPSNVQREGKSSNLQLEIYRTMEEADSLVAILTKHRDPDSECEVVTPPRMEWSRHPPDDRVVMEELHTINQHMRTLVDQLVTQLQEKTRQADELGRRVRQLEADQAQALAGVAARGGDGADGGGSLHVITDSTGNCSPFVFSPCGELSPDVGDPHTPRALPVLAPLEMPNFDFSVFERQQPDGEL